MKKKTIEKQGHKQTKTLENGVEKKLLDTDIGSIPSLFSKYFQNEETTYELDKIIKMKKIFNRDYSL